jgi:hypothetical protein
MSKADEYRRLAVECVTMAVNGPDLRTRAALLHMAEVWTRLAAEDEPIDEQQQQIRPKPVDEE